MLHLTIGLALITYWILLFTPVNIFLTRLIGIPFVDMTILAGCLASWGAIFLIQKKRLPPLTGLPVYLLAVGNAVWIIAIPLHAYVSWKTAIPASSVEEIMTPNPMRQLLYFLMTVMPFAKSLTIAGIISAILILFQKRNSCSNRELS